MLDDVVAETAVLATNTSALSVTEVAKATAHPERVVGMHFFNPAPVLPLVEVVRTELASATPSTRRSSWRSGSARSRSAATTPRGSSSTASSSASERLRARPGRGWGLARGSRQGDDARRQLADRPVCAHRPDRGRRPRPRFGGAPRGARRGADAPPDRLLLMRNEGKLGQPAKASTSTTDLVRGTAVTWRARTRAGPPPREPPRPPRR